MIARRIPRYHAGMAKGFSVSVRSGANRLRRKAAALIFTVKMALMFILERLKTSKVVDDEIIVNLSVLHLEFILSDRTQSHYSFVLPCDVTEAGEVLWRQSDQPYRVIAGDGFCGAWRVPYLEPEIARVNIDLATGIYDPITCVPDHYPVAKSIQSRLIQFKANYVNLNMAQTTDCTLVQRLAIMSHENG